jgi:hypothetical protein
VAQQETPTVDVTEQNVEEAANKALSDVFLAGAAFGIGTLIALMVQEKVTLEELQSPEMRLVLVSTTLRNTAIEVESVLANDGATLRA